MYDQDETVRFNRWEGELKDDGGYTERAKAAHPSAQNLAPVREFPMDNNAISRQVSRHIFDAQLGSRNFSFWQAFLLKLKGDLIQWGIILGLFIATRLL